MAAILGAIVGSFIMAVGWRIPRGINWLSGRSCCPQCGTQLAARDLLPIASWLLLGGKARCCGGAISCRYPLAEVAGAGAFVFPDMLIGPQPEVLALFLLFGFLAVISLVDISHRYIPDVAVACVWLLGLVSDWLGWFAPIDEGLLSSLAIGAILLAMRCVVGRYAGREALGLGDVKLFAAAGPWVGLEGLPILVFGSSAFALAFYPLWRRRSAIVEMPFGPAIATMLYLQACASG